jgi:putative membrane protein
MKITSLVFCLGLAVALSATNPAVLAADENGAKPTAMEKTFMKKAADGGMTEVNLGKLAAEKGESKEVKDFGEKMVKDHSKIGDDLKEVAGKLRVTLPDRVNAEHQAKIDKMEKMSGAAFDKAYVNAMVKAHEKDIADFQKADKEAKNEDLKKFIENAIPTMQEHLDMIRKFSQAKND